MPFESPLKTLHGRYQVPLGTPVALLALSFNDKGFSELVGAIDTT